MPGGSGIRGEKYIGVGGLDFGILVRCSIEDLKLRGLVE